MRRIVAVTHNFNQGYFLIPHIAMLKPYVDKLVVIQADKPWTGRRPDSHSGEPDNSRELLKRYYPEIEVIDDRVDTFSAAWCNQGLELFPDYDIVLRLDTDMFLEDLDLRALITHIRTTDYDCYSYNFKQRSINFYYDFEHGVKDAEEHDPIAVSPLLRHEGLTTVPSAKNPYMFDWQNIVIYHFKGIKADPVWMKRWIAGAKVPWSDVLAKDLPIKYNPSNQWISLPQSLKKHILKFNIPIPYSPYDFSSHPDHPGQRRLKTE